MTLANAHALFCGLKAEPSYLANLNIPDGDREGLMDARAKVRAALKAAAARLQLQDEYWQDAYRRAVRREHRPHVQVKFMTQGSFAYGTLNAPAQMPKQEIDLDDGMYVPVRFLDNGEPALAALGLFTFVESVLDPLCRAEGWTLDRSKDNCVRIKLWRGAHIDLPIYSIPQDRFETINESLAKSFAARSIMARDAMPSNWRLPSDKVMLAQRDGFWIQSDPQQLHDWVTGRSERYGPVYRRLSRFFKGWRDHTWETSRLSSLCIMCAIDIALRDMPGAPADNRDDELVMEVAKKLPTIFGGTVSNPVIKNLCLNEWENDERAVIVAAACKLRDEMVAALEGTGHADIVVRKLRDRFGARLPYRPDAVKIASQIEAIQRTAPALVAAPKVIASTSG